MSYVVPTTQPLVTEKYLKIESAPPVNPHILRWAISIGSFVWLLVVASFASLVLLTSETWWLGSLATYLPRVPLVLPAVLLLLLSLCWHRASAPVNLLTIVLVLGPVMEFRAPVTRLLAGTPSVAEEGVPVRVLSCNVQAWKPHFEKILEEIALAQPEIVAFQEARGLDPRVETFFNGWYSLHHDYYWIGSKYPVKLLGVCETKAYDRVAGIVVEVSLPSGPIAVANVHQMTARRGLSELDAKVFINGEAADILDQQVMLRQEEAAELRVQMEKFRGDRPLIVMGDFNTTTTSSLFQGVWGDYQSAFDTAGVGYGYSAPVTRKRMWLDDTPWARIDHILCSYDWYVKTCQIGVSNGSDHHLIHAELRRHVDENAASVPLE